MFVINILLNGGADLNETLCVYFKGFLDGLKIQLDQVVNAAFADKGS